jgi:hypothetical protein
MPTVIVTSGACRNEATPTQPLSHTGLLRCSRWSEGLLDGPVALWGRAGFPTPIGSGDRFPATGELLNRQPQVEIRPARR